MLNPDSTTGGVFATAQIFQDVFSSRFNSNTGALALLSLLSSCCVISNSSRMATASRLVMKILHQVGLSYRTVFFFQFWAMSRDGATPFSNCWSKVSSNTQVPVFSLICSSCICALLTFSLCWSNLAFDAIHSVIPICSLLANGIPICLKLLKKAAMVDAGPFKLGWLSFPFNLVSLLWIGISCFILCLPSTYPVMVNSLNYTPVIFAGVFTMVTLPWFLPEGLFHYPKKKLLERLS